MEVRPSRFIEKKIAKEKKKIFWESEREKKIGELYLCVCMEVNVGLLRY